MTAAIAREERPAVGPPPRAEILANNLNSMLLFGAFAAAGLFFRRRPDVHKRFMMLATIQLLRPALGRLTIRLFGAPKPALAFAATVLFVVALMIYDRRTRGRLHPVTLWGGLGLLLSFPAVRALGQTDLWLDFAAWLIH